MNKNGSRQVVVIAGCPGNPLILLLGVHWIAQHYLAAEGLRNYAEVSAYLRQPIILALETTFLVVITAHALLGVRAIFTDLGLQTHWQRALDATLWLIGLFTVLYGIQLVWQIVHQ